MGNPNLCKSCGKQLNEGSKFCDSCGAPVDEKSYPPPVGENTSTPPPPIETPSFNPYIPPKSNNNKVAIGCLIALAAFVVLGVIGTIVSKDESTSTATPTSESQSATEATETTETETAPEESYIDLNSTQACKDVDFTVLKYNFAQEVFPPNSNEFSMGYRVDDTSKTYLYLVIKVKNTSSVDLSVDSLFTIEAVYDDDYTYSGTNSIPNETLFDTFATIAPLCSNTVYSVIEVPLEVKSSGKPLIINIDTGDKTSKLKIR